MFHDSFFNSHIFQYCHLNHLLFYFCWFYLGCHILFPYIFCSRFESVGLLLLFYCEIFRNRWFYRTQPVAVFVAIALDVWWMSQHVLSDQLMIRSSQGRCCLHEYKILLTVPKIDWGLYWLRHLCYDSFTLPIKDKPKTNERYFEYFISRYLYERYFEYFVGRYLDKSCWVANISKRDNSKYLWWSFNLSSKPLKTVNYFCKRMPS